MNKKGKVYIMGAAGTEAARKEITEILRNVPVPEMNK